MNNLGWIVVLLALVALPVAGWTWWRHRARLAEMKRRLAWSEESRFQLEKHAETVDAKLQDMARTLQTQQQALQASRDAATRRAVLEAALDKAAGTTPSGWADTQPFGPPGDRYVPTLPAPLDAVAERRT